WDDYQNYRKQQRHLRLYGALLESRESVEVQSLAPRHALPAAIPEPFVSKNSSGYLQMPLAV
ncbi:MAG: hypothetical protein ABI621_02755, partial [Chloroflexota bacterium]